LRVAPDQTEAEANLAVGLSWLDELADDDFTHWQPRARALRDEIVRLRAAFGAHGSAGGCSR
jgi:hypothetical protein